MPGTTTTAQNPLAIATLVAARALAALRSNIVGFAVSDPSFGSELASHGDTVNVLIPPIYTTNLLSDGGTISRQNPAAGNAQLVLSQHRELSFEFTDRNLALARPDLKGTSLGQAMANFAEAVDLDLLGIYSSFQTTDVGAYNTALTEPVIDAAETTLFDEKVPANERLSLVVTGTGYSNLRQIPRFTEPDKTPGASGKSRAINGQIKGFDVYRAQQVTVTNSGTERHGLALSPTALLTATRMLGTENDLGVRQTEVQYEGATLRLTESYQHEVLGKLCTIDLLYGFTTGRDRHGVEVRH